MKKIEKIICCGQEIQIDNGIVKSPKKASELNYITAFYYCKKCKKEIRVYPSSKVAKEIEKKHQKKALTGFFRKELEKRGYHSFKDHGFIHHGEILLNELQEELAYTEMEILGEVKGDKAIIYLQPQCWHDIPESREPFKLPIAQVPANTKNIEIFNYLGVWEGWGGGEEPTPQDIWKDQENKSKITINEEKQDYLKKLTNSELEIELAKRKGKFIDKNNPLEKVFKDMDERMKRVEKSECYFLCGKILKEQKKMLVGKATHIWSCVDCENELVKKEVEKDALIDCPPFYWEVDLTEPNWEKKLSSWMVELATEDLETSDLYTEIARRKSLHKKEVKKCWECHKETDDWFHEYDDNYQCWDCHNDSVAEAKKENEKDKKTKIKCSECGKTKLLGYRRNYYTLYCKECWEFIKIRDRECYNWCAKDCPFKIKNEPKAK